MARTFSLKFLKGNTSFAYSPALTDYECPICFCKLTLEFLHNAMQKLVKI
ncbi:MAG: hypothetical protein ABIL46_02935 [candidate division WOR-3 bacterium]